jgi:hypothetical protein
MAELVAPNSRREVTPNMIRVVAAVLAVVVLFVIIWRRKRKAVE